jgi:hypothetical protein
MKNKITLEYKGETNEFCCGARRLNGVKVTMSWRVSHREKRWEEASRVEDHHEKSSVEHTGGAFWEREKGMCV